MPTGYTADIKDGISFETFAMNCARAFGACVMLRDEPTGGEHIPEEFAPSDYHAKAVQKAREELAALMAMTPEQQERRAAQEWDAAETRRLMLLEERQKTRASYEAMLVKVRAWTPPTSDHVEMRNFMIEQIQQSIEFDCDCSYWSTPTVCLSGPDWAFREAARLNGDIVSQETKHADEVQRAATRTKWVRDLRESLQPIEQMTGAKAAG